MNNDWLDIAVLEDYLDGKLDARTMNRVEREALEDPFVAEALAGLSQSPKRSLQSLSLLQKQLQERVAEQQHTKKTSVMTWQRLSIAATAAVLFVSVSIVYWMKENNNRRELAKQGKEVEVNLKPEDTITDAAAGAIVGGDALADLKPRPEDAKVSAEVEKVLEAAKANSYAHNTIDKNKKLDVATNDVPETEVQAADVAGFALQRKVAAKAMPAASMVSTAAAYVLSGKVVSQDDGKPLAGVSIQVEGSPLATITDANGEFRLYPDSTAKDSKLKATTMGFVAKQLNVQLNNPMVISLTESGALAEVAVAKAAAPAVQEASPVIGWEKFLAYLQENNRLIKEGKTGAMVELSFLIDKDGKPTDIKVLRTPGKTFEDEAIRLLNEGPKWEGGDPKKGAIRFRVDF